MSELMPAPTYEDARREPEFVKESEDFFRQTGELLHDSPWVQYDKDRYTYQPLLRTRERSFIMSSRPVQFYVGTQEHPIDTEDGCITRILTLRHVQRNDVRADITEDNIFLKEELRNPFLPERAPSLPEEVRRTIPEDELGQYMYWHGIGDVISYDFHYQNGTVSSPIRSLSYDGDTFLSRIPAEKNHITFDNDPTVFDEVRSLLEYYQQNQDY